MALVHGDDRATLDAGRFQIDQEEADAFLLLALGGGADEGENPIGMVGVARPDLLAVHHIVVAVRDGPRLQARQVGARARLGIALTPETLAGEDFWQMLRLLRLGAEGVDHRADHDQAEGAEPRRVRRLILLLENMPLHRGPACAAMLLWPVGRDPALPVKDFVPLPRGFLRDVGGRQFRLSPYMLGQLLGEECADFIAKGAVFGRILGVHIGASLRRSGIAAIMTNARRARYISALIVIITKGMRPMPGPLDGVKILDLTTVGFGPYATQILGDYGADIIKVESPEGDITRHIAPARNPGMGHFFLNANRNKRCLMLDLKAAKGREALLKLAETADAIVTSIRPAAMGR